MTLYCSIFILCCLLSPVCSAETVVLANGEWLPFQSQNLKHYGVVTHIVTEAFKSQGITTEYVFLPWTRALRRAKNGVYDGSLVWDIAQTDKTAFHTGDPVLKGETVFFYLTANEFDWQELSDLNGLRMGAVLGHQYKDELLEAVEIQMVRGNLQNFRKLLLGRIDITYADRLVGLAIIEKHLNPEEVKLISVHPRAYNSNDYTLILNRRLEKNERLIESFNRGLAQLRANGKFEKFMQAHLKGQYE